MKKFQGRTSPEATATATDEKGKEETDEKQDTERARFVKQKNVVVNEPRYNLRTKINLPKRLQY
jgi:hypothetical protein